MADEIIKLIEYITEHTVFQGTFIACVVIGTIITTAAIAIIQFAFCQILKSRKRWK